MSTAATGTDWGTAVMMSLAAALTMFMEAIPRVVGFLVILLIGWLIAAAVARAVSTILRTVRFNALGRLIRGAAAESGLGKPDLLASVGRIAVWALAIVVAVNQIDIATSLVNTLFTATIGGIALALGLAFGLGGRETAGLIVRSWYESGQLARPRILRATSSLSRNPDDDRSESETVAPLQARPSADTA